MSTADIANLINEASTTSAPTYPYPLSNTVELLRGLAQDTDDGKVWHTTAVVRELTGEDEEYLASLEKRNPNMPYTQFMNALLERGVESIGDLPVSEPVLSKLILADRDMLYLGILRATYGREKELRVMCGQRDCGTWQNVTIDLDEDFPVTAPDFDIRQPIEVKLKNGTVKLRMPNGEDILSIQKHSDNAAEYNTQMIARCAVFEEGQQPIDRVQWAKGLSIPDRRKLVNTLLELDLGPHLEVVNTQCVECGADMPILLDWVSLLLR